MIPQPLKYRFALAKCRSKNFIYFRHGKNSTYGVHGELPILASDIKVEQPRPNVSQLKLAPFVARATSRVPTLIFGKPSLIFERIYFNC
jgi:hypothetical protein